MTTTQNLARKRRWSAAVQLLNWLLATSVVAVMAACGGGAPCAAPPEGLQPATTSRFAVGGVIDGRADSSFILLTVPSSLSASWSTVPYTRLMVYGPDLAASAAVTGFVQAGDSYLCNGTLSFNGWDTGSGGDYWVAGEVYLRTTVASSPATVSGSMRSMSASYTLSGGPLPGAAPGYSFDQKARLVDVAGRWDMKLPNGDGFALVVDADGTLTATPAAGEPLAGSLAPSPGEVSLFDLLLGYDVGGALAYPLANGQWQMLLWRWSSGPFEDVLSVAIGRR